MRGKVQGVGFRDYIAKRAQLLGLSGWVRNLPDGESIEAVAEGDIASLETFAQEMMHGPRVSSTLNACEQRSTLS